MTILVTDQDVLTALGEDDAIATAVDAAYASTPTTPASVLAAWKADLASYQAFASDARSQASGGFFGGAWFGVPDLYNAALTWGQRLQTYAADARSRGATLPQLPAIPAPSAPASVDSLGSMDASTKILIGLGLVTVLVLAVKR